MSRHRFAATRAAVGVSLLSAVLLIASAAWTPVAAQATRSVTFIIETPAGRPVPDLSVSWWATDGSAQSSTGKFTDADGRVSWAAVPLTEVRVEGISRLGARSGSGEVTDGPSLRWVQRTLDVPDTGPVVVSTGPMPDIRPVTVRVRMPDGTPVGESVQVGLGHGFERADGLSYILGSTRRGPDVWNEWFACPSWEHACKGQDDATGSALVDADGNASTWRFVEPQTRTSNVEGRSCYNVSFDDGELHQNAKADCSDEPGVTVTLPYMPVVAPLEPPLKAYPPGAEVEIPVSAVDGSDAPIGGQDVNVESVAGSAVATAAITTTATCRAKLTARTGAAGRATLRLCATKTRMWRVDGPSIVASRPFQILVRKKGSPTKPRDVTVARPAPDRVVLRWRAPVRAGRSKIKRYQVRRSGDGGYRWSEWMSTGRERRFVGDITPGKKVLFQVRAVNGRGGGAVALRRVTG